MSWLSDASANKIVQSYVNNFMDVSGNFKVRNEVTTTSGGGSSSVDTTGASWTQLGSDIDGLAADTYFGYKADLNSDGTILAAGGFNYNSARGYVSVYQYGGGGWDQLGSRIDGEASGDQFGINVALNDDGTILAVGGRYNDGGGSNAGHVRVYKWDGSSWNQLGSDIDGEAASDYFGMDVALNGDGTIMAAGATNNDGSATDAGHVRVYEWDGSSWNQLGGDIDGEAAYDQSGFSVALSNDGTIVAIGARYNDGGAGNSGHARIYEYSGGSWSQMGGDIDGVGGNTMAGWSIDLNYDGTTVIIGSIENSTGPGGSRAGEAKVFNWDGSSWNQVGSDIHGVSSQDRLGIGVAINGDGTIIGVGARFDDGTAGSNSGVGSIYHWDGTSWNQIGDDISGEASDDQGGNSVGLSDDGTIFLWNAYFNDGAGSNAGHVRVFDGGFTGTSSSGGGDATVSSKDILDVSAGTVSMLSNTMDISSGVVDISGTTWLNEGKSGHTISTAYQKGWVIESDKTSSSDAVLHVETAGQTQAFSVRANGDVYSDNTLRHSSDDRRKINEQHITNAMETINKLSPQVYIKLNDLVENGGTYSKIESGLIAQEIYYNAPELRHLVTIQDENGNKLTPQEYDLSGNDIQNDPDYTALGWGNKSAYVDYIGLIPYLITANQEKQAILEQQDATITQQTTQVEELKTRLSSLEA